MTAPIIDDTATCRAHSCWSRAAAVVTTGCVHEHIETGPICQTHIDALAHGELICTPCIDCAEPHLCILTVITLEVLP